MSVNESENLLFPENAGAIQDTRFKAGKSGNPSGKPKGTLNRATRMMALLLEGEAEALTRKVIDMALDGDMAALKLCMDRLFPPLRPSMQRVQLADYQTSGSPADLAHATMAAALNGEIPSDIAAQLLSGMTNVSRIDEMQNIQKRLDELERTNKSQKENRDPVEADSYITAALAALEKARSFPE